MVRLPQLVKSSQSITMTFILITMLYITAN